nr:MAG TPA: hypothetical protein [Caudoviricetes sp.]
MWKAARAARSLCKAKFGEDATRQTRVFFSNRLPLRPIRGFGAGEVSPCGAREQKLL